MATKRKTTPAAPVDDEGQVTPTGDALSESEVVDSSAGAGTSLAQIAAALRGAGVSAARETLDRAFTRDQVDSDIGLEEAMKFLLVDRLSGITALGNALDHVKAIKAMNNEETQHGRNSDASYYAGIQKSDSTFQSALLKAYALETDNEVLSTTALAKIVDNMAQRVERIESAILAADRAE